MDQNNKAYYLTDLELALLLSLKGMKELYGFRMKHIQNPEQTFIYQAIFELEKKKLLSFQKSQKIHMQNKENIVINPGLDQMLDSIKDAGKILLYINKRSEHPDQCIYLGGEAVFVSGYGATGSMNRIESISVGELPEAVCECGFCIEELLSDESIHKEEEIENPEIQRRADALFDKEFTALDKEEWGNVTDCLKMVSAKSRKCIRQYLLIRDGLNDYFSVTDKEGSHIFLYSKKRVTDTLEYDI